MGALAEADTRPGGRDDRLLAWPAVRDITGLSRTTAWRIPHVGAGLARPRRLVG